MSQPPAEEERRRGWETGHRKDGGSLLSHSEEVLAWLPVGDGTGLSKSPAVVSPTSHHAFNLRNYFYIRRLH